MLIAIARAYSWRNAGVERRAAGLVHIPGVADPQQTATTMRDPHRVLVDAEDRIDNIGRLRALIVGGYAGPISFEPFAASVHDSNTIERDLQASLEYVRAGLR